MRQPVHAYCAGDEEPPAAVGCLLAADLCAGLVAAQATSHGSRGTGAFDAPGANGPACLLIGRVLHVHFVLLQVAQFLLQSWTGIASGQPGQVGKHPLWPLVFEPV
jgi:hypothetical protein